MGLNVQLFVVPSSSFVSEDVELWCRFDGDFWISGWAVELLGGKKQKQERFEAVKGWAGLGREPG